jgi:riboflavin biosynthesis pyrimidine reductase
VLILTSRRALIERADIVKALERSGAIVDAESDGILDASIENLTARGVNWVILEGGRALHEAAWRQGVVDRVQIYRSPITLGSGAVPWLSAEEMSPSRLDNVQMRALGPDTLIEGDVHRID